MHTIKAKSRRREHFLKLHSLSLATLAIVILWIVLYSRSDQTKHAGAFFGNAIADWSGTLVIIIATKYFFESGSEESRPIKNHIGHKIYGLIRAHSLSLFLIVTGALWFALYCHMDADSKWGQVVGNIASEWVQTLGLVLMTKFLLERGSKESRKC